MSEKAEWVIEVYDSGLAGWSLSRLNENAEGHSLEWCMDRWNARSAADVGTAFLTEPYRYRLRNVNTEDIIMCAIL